jgi:P pilus assembly chaperone PapD
MSTNMRRILSFTCLTIVLTIAMHAQSVRPAVVEYTAAAEGQYELVNDGLTPLFVTVEAKSFTIDNEGVAHFTKLDSAIHLTLSETSVRIPPHSHRTIFYKASANAYPAWFCVYSNFSGMPKRNSMNVELELPHTVYLRSKTEAKRDEITFDNLHIEADELRGTVHNRSANMVRLQSMQLISKDGRKNDVGGFPLLPNGARELHLPISEGAQALRAKLNRFTIDQPITATKNQ